MKCIMSFFFKIIPAGRYFTSSTGDLYIRTVKADDNLKKIACQTTNKISKERKISEPVHLSVKGKLLLLFLLVFFSKWSIYKKKSVEALTGVCQFRDYVVHLSSIASFHCRYINQYGTDNKSKTSA